MRDNRVYNPWVFANYGQPQRQRGYISPLVYQSRYPQPFVRMPRTRRWRGDPWFNDPLGQTDQEKHDEIVKLMYISLSIGALGLILSWSGK